MSLTAIDVDNPNCAKDRILLAAGRIFSEKGFRCSTVREICDAAEVNIASVNYYFGDKKKLYAETLLLAREIGAQKFPIPDLSVLATSEDRLRSIILLLLNRLVGTHDEPWPVKILMSEILNPSPAAKPLIDGYIQPFLKMVFATVKEMVDDSVSVSQCVWYRFAGDINRMVIDEEEFNDNFAINHLAKQILDFSLAGISAVGSNSSGRISTSTMAEKAHPIKRPKKPTDARAVVESATSPV
jgi:AcrR family transcriptional regulator